ncbi:MAG: N-acetylhexosamine 1-kinase [Bacteroidetes bacterium ADurb.Bin037]|nr:MAG: N-acetylhexosamine 1-kinase [Bacteroidetes bacterium ADurb.Bin037]HPW79142.1 aminoglycoside phosphotransferase family protein [Bacteroidales bacterium]HQB55785.1 aminoglycoside phosphotransferase family protein [Bacteroidales bacterium]
MSDAKLIITHFCIPEHVIGVTALGEGFINDTFLVETAKDEKKYILQRKNKTVFPDIPGMMDNIRKVTGHILSKGEITLQLIPSADHLWYYQDKDGEYWTCFTYIQDTYTHDVAGSLDLIRAGGEGIGTFHSLLSDFHEPLIDTLPGFHNISYRFEQFSVSVQRDAASRMSEVVPLVDEVLCRKERMLSFLELIQNKTIPERVSHNDTKLSNFLFDRNGKVVCAIDLDTVMRSTVLYDFGDAVRSYTNPFAEDHPNHNQVQMDLDRFTSLSEGYLSKAAWFLNEEEKTHLAFSALYITYEQFLRFLMDYIDGDTYYRIRYPSHNLVRARSQLALLKSMEDRYSLMQNKLFKIINTL